MRKSRLIIVILFLIQIKCVGQRFNGFVYTGISTSQVSGDALGGFDKAGVILGAGVVSDVSRNHKTLVGMEIGYIQKGSRKPSKLAQGDVATYLLRLNYLEVPLYLKHAITSKFYAYAGGAIGVLTSSLEENEMGVSYDVPFNKFDVSILGGMEYEITSHWHMNLRLIQSVAPIREFGGEVPYAFFDNGQYNTVLAFTLNYFFKTKK